MVNDPDKLGHFITFTMNRLIQAGKGFTWDDYCSTAEWAVIAMNLSEEDKHKFGGKWKEIYDILLTPEVKLEESDAKEENIKEVEKQKDLYNKGKPEVSPEEFNSLSEDKEEDGEKEDT